MKALDSEESLFRARVTAGFLCYAYLAGSFMGCFRLLQDGIQPASIATFLTIQLFLVGIYFLKYRRDVEQAGELIILAGILVITIVLLTDRGLHSRVLVWIPLMPVMANFFQSRISGLITLFAFICILCFVYYLHLSDWISAPIADEVLLHRLVATTISSMFATAVSHFYEESRRRANAEFARLERTRREWISIVSHELRTPLTAMRGAISMLNHGLFDDQPDQASKIINVAYSNTERLVRLVNDVLDIEKMETGKFILSVDKEDLRKIVEQAIATQATSAEKKSITIRLQAPKTLRCYIDEDRILQVLQNLLSNAIKFAPSASTIELDLRRESQYRIYLSVTDQGPGIPEDFAAKLFQRFEQAESGDNRKQEGSGLGLYICKTIVEKHGGEIGFENLSRGGCRFHIRLPQKPA